MKPRNQYIKKNWILPPEQQNDIDCGQLVTPILNNAQNDMRLNLSGEEFIRLLSSIEQGASILYPDNQHELTDKFLSGLVCPPEIDSEDGDCYDYPIFAPFITYYPYNPFNGDSVPDGYQEPPFYIHDGGNSFPPAYQNGDLIVPFTAIRLIDYTIFGNPISIKIEVFGSGQIEIDLLSIPAGGVAILKVGENPPNAIDIINGVFDPDTETIIELNLDTFQSPPEDDIISAQEIEITAGAGVKSTVWISFLPVIDDSLIPFRFGGGLRAIQLCGFEEQGIVSGITNIRIENGVLEYFLNGVWSPVGAVLEDCTDVENCLSSSPIITNIQTQATFNANSIAGLQSQIDSNDADISNLQTQIDSNDADIVGLQTQIDSNDADITQLFNQQNGLISSVATLSVASNDHETRITTLENQSPVSGNGLLELISSQYLSSDDNFVPVDVSDYRYIKIIASVARGTGGNFGLLICNDDTNISNYDTTFWAGANGICTTATRASGQVGGYTQIIMEYGQNNDNNQSHVFNVESATPNGLYVETCSINYLTTGNLNTINIVPETANFLANSTMLVLGIKKQNSIPSDLNNIAQSLYFDFSINNAPGIFSINSGSYNSGSGYYVSLNNVDLQLTSNYFDSLNITGYELILRSTDDSTEDNEVYIGNLTDSRTFNIGGSMQPVSHAGAIDMTGNFTFRTDGLALGQTELHGMRLTVIGTIPTELQSYIEP